MGLGYSLLKGQGGLERRQVALTWLRMVRLGEWSYSDGHLHVVACRYIRLNSGSTHFQLVMSL